MKSDKVITLALAGRSNAEISEIVGSRPRRVREILSAAIRAGAPIAPNAERMASRGAGNGAGRPEGAIALMGSQNQGRPTTRNPEASPCWRQSFPLDQYELRPGGLRQVALGAAVACSELKMQPQNALVNRTRSIPLLDCTPF